MDCDPGLDDVIALIMAFANEKLDVKGVTVVAGNQTLKKVGDNALKVLSYINVDVPVALGSEFPLVKTLLTAGEVHGEDGIGGVVLPESNLKLSNLHAIDLMAKVIRESGDKVTIIATGPLTNIGLFLRRYPELKNKIERISLMGGSVGFGNVTPSAEFNIFIDPEAADIVFKSGIPIIMSGLNATQKAIFSMEDINNIRAQGGKIAQLVSQMLENLWKYHSLDGMEGCYLHDPVAVCAVTNPEILKTELLNVDIELKGEFTTGMTVVDIYKRLGKKGNADVLMEIDKKAYVDLILEAVNKYN
ncbi:MAG: nucleoside hydrolase [Tissierellia bacterium]|nr:nucleoside hydrolase [Tissierellia bacterium]